LVGLSVFKSVFAALFGAAVVFACLPASADDWTDIRYYTAGKDIARVAAMLDRGVSVNIRNDEGWTPLMIAAEAGDLAMVRFILSKGGDPAITNTRGQTAFDVTLSNDVKALLRPGYNAAAPAKPAVATAGRPPAVVQAGPATPPIAPKSPANKERSDFCQSQYRAAVAAFCSDDTCKMRENRKWSACLKSGRYN
jgi:hypothetical protein